MTNEEALKAITAFVENYACGSDLEGLREAIEVLKTETKKCPNCGSDLYEYCFMCCYEGKKVRRKEGEAE